MSVIISRTAIEEGISIEVEEERLGMVLRLKEDLRDSKIYLGDYVRLRSLTAGDIIYLREEGTGNSYVVLVGNATMYNGVTSVSDEGWDWDLYNSWKVEYVLRLGLEANGSWLSPDYIKKVKQILAEK